MGIGKEVRNCLTAEGAGACPCALVDTCNPSLSLGNGACNLGVRTRAQGPGADVLDSEGADDDDGDGDLDVFFFFLFLFEGVCAPSISISFHRTEAPSYLSMFLV